MGSAVSGKASGNSRLLAIIPNGQGRDKKTTIRQVGAVSGSLRLFGILRINESLALGRFRKLGGTFSNSGRTQDLRRLFCTVLPRLSGETGSLDLLAVITGKHPDGLPHPTGLQLSVFSKSVIGAGYFSSAFGPKSLLNEAFQSIQVSAHRYII